MRKHSKGAIGRVSVAMQRGGNVPRRVKVSRTRRPPPKQFVSRMKRAVHGTNNKQTKLPLKGDRDSLSRRSPQANTPFGPISLPLTSFRFDHKLSHRVGRCLFLHSQERSVP